MSGSSLLPNSERMESAMFMFDDGDEGVCSVVCDSAGVGCSFSSSFSFLEGGRGASFVSSVDIGGSSG